MKTILLILFVLSLLSSIGNTTVKQYGVILPNDPGNYNYCCIYSPPKGFKIFNSPGGKQTGILTRNTKANNKNDSEYRLYFVDRNTKSATKIEGGNFKEIGYEIFAIPFFERRGGFVRILNESFDYWISEKEIVDQDFRLVDWQQFFIEGAGKFSGFYAKDPGLALKAKPSIYSESKIELHGHLFEIVPTKEVDGRWTKVKVKKYKEHPCANGNYGEENVEFIVEGWLETITKIGKPNLWYYPRGC